MAKKVVVASALRHSTPAPQALCTLWAYGPIRQWREVAEQILDGCSSLGSLAGLPLTVGTPWMFGDRSGPAAELPAHLAGPPGQSARVHVDLDPLPGQVQALKALVDLDTTLVHLPGYTGPPLRLRIDRRNLVCLKTTHWPRGYTASHVAQVLLQDPSNPVEVLRVQQVMRGNLLKSGEFFITAFVSDRHPQKTWDLVDEAGSSLAKLHVSSVSVGSVGQEAQGIAHAFWQWDSAAATAAAEDVPSATVVFNRTSGAGAAATAVPQEPATASTAAGQVRPWTQLVPPASPLPPNSQDVDMTPPRTSSKQQRKNQKKNQRKKEKKMAQRQGLQRSPSLPSAPPTGLAIAAAAPAGGSTPMEADPPSPPPLAAAAAAPVITGGAPLLHSNRFAPLLPTPPPADPPSAWRGAVRQYLDNSVGLEDTLLVEDLIQQFGLAFAQALPSLNDTAASLSHSMVDWLQAHVPAAHRGSYGGDSDTST